jgi:hypothetical protein
LLSGGFFAPQYLQITLDLFLRGTLFFQGLTVCISTMLDFLAIQKMSSSEKMMSAMAMIIEMTTGLENIGL